MEKKKVTSLIRSWAEKKKKLTHQLSQQMDFLSRQCIDLGKWTLHLDISKPLSEIGKRRCGHSGLQFQQVYGQNQGFSGLCSKCYRDTLILKNCCMPFLQERSCKCWKKKRKGDVASFLMIHVTTNWSRGT